MSMTLRLTEGQDRLLTALAGAERVSKQEAVIRGLCEELGGLKVRDFGLLDAAAHRPASTVFGEDAYLDLHTKAAAWLQSVVRNHTLVDGNKRLCWVATYVFYGLNGYTFDAPEDDA
jgi:death on curing protein